MNREAEMLEAEMHAGMLEPDAEQSATPSVGFIQAISQFLDTDPADLLVELGYYSPDQP